MFTYRSVNYTYIEENLACTREFLKFFDRGIELIVIISSQGRDPRLDFLPRIRKSGNQSKCTNRIKV